MNRKKLIILITIALAVIIAGLFLFFFTGTTTDEPAPDNIPVKEDKSAEMPDSKLSSGDSDKSSSVSPGTGNKPDANLASQNAVENTDSYSEEDLREIVTKIANERFGHDAFVLLMTTEGPTPVEIEGSERLVYIYAVDSLSERQKSGKIRGLYHVDILTGEIFDNGDGTMKKVDIGG